MENYKDRDFLKMENYKDRDFLKMENYKDRDFLEKDAKIYKSSRILKNLDFFKVRSVKK